jgi:hypothetical protein
MRKAVEKLKRIKNALKVYKNDKNMSIRETVKLYKVNSQSIINYLNDEITSAPDYYAFNQKLTPI